MKTELQRSETVAVAHLGLVQHPGSEQKNSKFRDMTSSTKKSLASELGEFNLRTKAALVLPNKT